MATLLDVQNLSISFRTYRGILAATHDVTLHVDAGETVGIVGESGCGKSVTACRQRRLSIRPAPLPGMAKQFKAIRKRK